MKNFLITGRHGILNKRDFPLHDFQRVREGLLSKPILVSHNLMILVTFSKSKNFTSGMGGRKKFLSVVVQYNFDKGGGLINVWPFDIFDKTEHRT